MLRTSKTAAIIFRARQGVNESSAYRRERQVAGQLLIAPTLQHLDERPLCKVVRRRHGTQGHHIASGVLLHDPPSR